ncbi:Ltp family lipoprotein [Microbacterium maritypicum]|uniref:PASTA domain-containing protein n=1 Tax=Microbacterium maritypicum MF109 TaxID=1333857 RepID=T5KTT9_MICMQ|nr:Ltp family lipoprotein [Microbacterium liquefaciens]EQM83434.1 hypothetical protein L687_12505 [Microbacterium maritypicum MF109]
MSDPTPAAGWYPAPHANNEQRYWDGTQWLEPQPTPTIDASTSAGVSSDATTPAEAEYPAKAKMPAKKKWIIGGSIAAGVILIGSIGSALGLGNKDDAPTADTKPTTAAEPVEEEASPSIVVPDVVGIPVSDAIVVLTEAGLTPPALTTFEDPTALVVSTSRTAGSAATDGAAISIVVEEKPKLTLAQQNAIGKAQSYLSFSGFSRSGLIQQLEFEGFSTEDATFGADNAGADWNAECAQKAQSYMDMSSFSRQSLYDQLAFEGFQPTEIEFGLAAVGY